MHPVHRAFREDEALAVLKRFRAQYPPTELQRPLLPSPPVLPEPAGSATTSSESDHAVALGSPFPPLPVRISSPLYPETAPPLDPLRSPYLVFKDLRVLHQRLADVGDRAGLATVTGVAKSYEKALAAAERVERRKEGLRR